MNLRNNKVKLDEQKTPAANEQFTKHTFSIKYCWKIKILYLCTYFSYKF